ncbi:hypothetical protein [Limibacterium fermenti]|uniref:hypothetical protein n=1 Tax=Limibacterium fermenti TaxID=3229863 RepID=UPI003A6FDB0E
MMKTKEFIEAVKEMRTCQCAYFRTRRSVELQKAKASERKVDEMIREMNESPVLF